MGFDARVEILPDPETLARHVAGKLLAAAIAAGDRFAVALSGGSTPRRLYELLASPPCLASFPWGRVHWFWGDERFVPPADAESNYRLAREAMLSRAPVPPANIHAVPTEGMAADAGAAAYEHELKAFYGADRLQPARPLFDVVLLGLGEDGHTASLFPGTAALAERGRWVVAVPGAQSTTRVTLTYPALESSREAAFLVSGQGKRAVLARLRQGDQALPAARLRPQGALVLYADEAAAGGAA